VHKYFSPSLLEIENAREMLRLSKEAISEGKGVALKNGVFIGPPMVNAALSILKKQELINKKIKI